jgi:hypothetical protein
MFHYFSNSGETNPPPDHYDWESMKCISKGNDHDLAEAAQIDPELIPGQATETKLLKTSKVAKWMTGILTAALLILWPFPMFGSGYIFSKEFFTGWVVIGVIWVFAVFICVGIYPVWEGRNSIGHMVKAIFMDITGKRHVRAYHIQGVNAVEDAKVACQTPTKFGMVSEEQEAIKS